MKKELKEIKNNWKKEKRKEIQRQKETERDPFSLRFMCVLPNRQKKKVMEKIELEKKKYIFYRGFKRSRTSENKAPPKMGAIFLNSLKSNSPNSTNIDEVNHKTCKRWNI